MKKKLVSVGLLIACISFFSFKEVCNDNDETCVKQKLQGKGVCCGQQTDDEAWKFSPLYNFLKI
ncbi:MAG: hypothetical protein E6H06_14055 [Bacteroidetes bacterium]|nr:MAG: hypothetical protein E6H06_14055 [Bacteroidota bacterium]